jgi:hypothetical protein
MPKDRVNLCNSNFVVIIFDPHFLKSFVHLMYIQHLETLWFESEFKILIKDQFKDLYRLTLF